MSRGPITICPICKTDVGMNAHNDAEAKDELARHIVAFHTKRKNGQPTIMVPTDKEPILNPELYSRAQRRNAHKAARGNGYGRRPR